MLTKEQYEAKRQARYERLLAAAEKAGREGKSSLNSGSQMLSFIPMGQPILVGHHSESRDRNYRNRADNKIRRGYDLMKKADSLRERAEAIVQNRAIFSDDPEAVEKIGGQLAQLEARQERMKAANKLVRKNDRQGLLDMGYTESQIERLFTPDFCGRIGYPDYKITNNGANIRRLKERAQVIEKRQATQDTSETVGDVKIEYSPSENRIRIYYPGRVDRETFGKLRQHGFRVLASMGEGAFSAYYNNNALYFVKVYVKGQRQ